MPFDFKEYQSKCDGMSTEQLHKEWENYTRQVSGGATSTATSVLFAPVTGGISLVGLGLSAPKIHNARKKREIIEAGLKARGTTHNTRKRDVIVPMAITGSISAVTLGLAGPVANAFSDQVVGHGLEYATAHVALDAGGTVVEHHHGNSQKLKADQKLQQQYENFKIQYTQQQTVVQHIQSPVTGHQTGLQIPGSTQFPQPTSPLSPTGVNLPGPPPYQPPYQPQAPPQDYKYEVVPVPPSYDTKPQPMVAQQQTTFYTGASVRFDGNQASYQQTSIEAQQVNTPPAQHISSSDQQNYALPFGISVGFPTEKPPIAPQSTPIATPLPPYSARQTLPAQIIPPLQHRPSLPTPTITPQPTAHRFSLPTSPVSVHNVERPPSPIYEMSTSTGFTSPTGKESMLSMEEELALLRVKVLQMELEKRGEHVEVTPEVEGKDTENEDPKSPEIPETFAVATFAPEPPRKTKTLETNPKVTPAVQASHPSAGPKLNVFVDLQQPVAQHGSKQDSKPQNVLPYPTSGTPQPERQQYKPPPPQSSAQPPVSQEALKTGLSITGGTSISYSQAKPHSQASPITTQNTDARPGSVPTAQNPQSPLQPQGAPVSNAAPKLQSVYYQTYNPENSLFAAVKSQSEISPQNQSVPITYTPPQQTMPELQSHNLVQQAPPHIQHQQNYPQSAKPPPPLQHQDSGYYSNPPSRQSSTFSVSTKASFNLNNNQDFTSPPTPSISTVPAKAPLSQQQYNRHSSYNQVPITYTPSPMSPPTQPYFPPPPSSAAPPNKDYFAQSKPALPPRVLTPNPQMHGYQPTAPNPAPNYGGQAYQPGPPPPTVNYASQQGGSQGWQWGNASAKATGEPNYGPPPPIPGMWRGS